MLSSPSPIHLLQSRFELEGSGLRARRTYEGWVLVRPELDGWTDPAGLARACRQAAIPERDGLLVALLSVAAADQLAQLTVMAGLADRLAVVVRGWRRAGTPLSDLEAMETDLVAECWVATARLAAELAGGRTSPPRVSWWLVDQARERVRVPRRRELRAAARQVRLPDSAPARNSDPRTTAERLAIELADAVHQGRVSLAAVRPVFLTRVAGFAVPEAAQRLGCTPAVVRAVRSRAERCLAA